VSLGGRVRHLSAVTLVDARGKQEIICQILPKVKNRLREIPLSRLGPRSSLEAIGTAAQLAVSKEIGIVQRRLGQ
jgi:hypothetical protein